MSFALQLYKSTETSFVPANLKFGLDPSDFNIDDAKSIESFDIPSMIWNTHFDSSIVTSRWNFRGKFTVADSGWSGAPNFTGRAFDFIHELRSLVKGVNPTTGDYPYSGISDDTSTDMLIMQLSETYASGEETYNTKTAYGINSETGKANTPIYVIPERPSFKKIGGVPGIIEYSLPLLEISEVIRL